MKNNGDWREENSIFNWSIGVLLQLCPQSINKGCVLMTKAPSWRHRKERLEDRNQDLAIMQHLSPTQDFDGSTVGRLGGATAV